ncbi:Sodium/potassium/calcium exchanger Nckx30C-like 2 [Homarus americanus]|uniref:Sodium/potassium/calcium exchanger Nckx30C-like 2 n=1 Tax=Homarus americanus TaxID=6706 RepID=A0A8J5MTK9_HOMAM|nr:Sodium/potassium/calcium exchanger Nckx30C-like 2 [Homarus americanus]
MGKVDEKATQLHAIASLKVLLDATKPQNGRVETYRSDGLAPDPRPDNQSHPNGSVLEEITLTNAHPLISMAAIRDAAVWDDIEPENALTPVETLPHGDKLNGAQQQSWTTSNSDAVTDTGVMPHDWLEGSGDAGVERWWHGRHPT